jgi:hypothetical protein
MIVAVIGGRIHICLAGAVFMAAFTGMPFGLLAQDFAIGGIAGGSLTDAARTASTYSVRTWSPTKDWIAGAMFELRLRSSFLVEADALYRELHASIASVESNGSLSGVSPFRVETFEFPVLAKYRFSARRVKPFVEAGPSFRATGNLNFFPSHHGVSAGLGLETHWQGIDIAPVVRYTHWAQDILTTRSVSGLNQVELLVGVSRASESHWRPLGAWVSLGVVAQWELTSDISPYSAAAVVSVAGSGNTITPAEGTEYVTGVRIPMVGPTLEIYLPRQGSRVSLELDGIYRPLQEHDKTLMANGVVFESVTHTETATWEFPVLPKYRFRLGKVYPFAAAGPSFRIPVRGLSAASAMAGAGVETHWHALYLAPAFRFTRWGAGDSLTSGEFSRNEAVLLVEFLLGGPSRAKR